MSCHNIYSSYSSLISSKLDFGGFIFYLIQACLAFAVFGVKPMGCWHGVY
uniref:Uncharacterized protein n=1 Tax=Rhizophora mucronata TaxID=61149 RepID=A0A2P2QBI4_RHIMU